MTEAAQAEFCEGPPYVPVGHIGAPSALVQSQSDRRAVMLAHTQTIFASEEANGFGVYGDCVRACVASIAGLHMEAVPHFMSFLWWEGAITLWARGIGVDPQWITAPPIPDEPSVLLGKSPRGRGHAVVGLGGEVFWDPHPSRDGLASVEQAIVFPKWERTGNSPCWVCGVTKPSMSTEGSGSSA